MNTDFNQVHQKYEQFTCNIITPPTNKAHVQAHQSYLTNISNSQQKKRLDYLEDLIETQFSEAMSSAALSKINSIFQQKATHLNNIQNFSSHKFAPQIQNQKFYLQNRDRKSSQSSLQTPFTSLQHLNRPRVLSYESKVPKNIPYESSFGSYPHQNQANKEALKAAARGTVEDLGQAKQAVKQLGHEAKETVKNEAKQATKEIVGQENYAILSAVKGAVGQIKQNVVNSVKAIQSAIANEAIQVANSIVNVAEQNGAELENSISYPKEQTYKGPLLTYQSDAQSSRETPHFSYLKERQRYPKQVLLSPPDLGKNVNSKIILSPLDKNIELNNDLKRTRFVLPLSFILICTLVGIGFGLALFQIIMDD